MPDENPQEMDVEKLIEERERLDRVFNEQFKKTITVMFTDLKGSTAIAEAHGDLAHRSMLKQHNDIVFPLIAKHAGTLVKTMGDGTMSYFSTPQEAVRSAADIQKGIEAFNVKNRGSIPILIRIGIHTGKGIVEQKDIFGDVVNVASRIEGQALPGEICLSEEAYLGLSDKDEIYCGFNKDAVLKGKKEPVKLYKAYWDPTEREKALPVHAPPPAKSGPPVKVIVSVLLALLAAFILFKWNSAPLDDERRTREHDVIIGQPSRP